MIEATVSIKRIGVFGAATDLWLLAALMKKSLPPDVEIFLIDDGSEAQHSGIAVRLDDPLLAALDIGIELFQQADSASFALGTDLINWQGEGSQGNRLNVHCRIAAFMQASSHAAERRFCGRLILPGARRSRFIAA